MNLDILKRVGWLVGRENTHETHAREAESALAGKRRFRKGEKVWIMRDGEVVRCRVAGIFEFLDSKRVVAIQTRHPYHVFFGRWRDARFVEVADFAKSIIREVE